MLIEWAHHGSSSILLATWVFSYASRQPQYDEKLLKNLLRAWRRLRMNWSMLNWVRKKWCMSVQRQADDIEGKKHPKNCKDCPVHSLAVSRSCKCHVLYCRLFLNIVDIDLSLHLSLSQVLLNPSTPNNLNTQPQLEIISKDWSRRYLATIAFMSMVGDVGHSWNFGAKLLVKHIIPASR